MKLLKILTIVLAIGYSSSSPTPRKCNRKHLFEARVDQPAYYVFHPERFQYPYADEPILPVSSLDELSGAQARKYNVSC